LKTIITKNIDKFEIIVAIASADGLIDAVATEKIVKDKIQETETFNDIQKIKKQINLYAVQAGKAKTNAKNAKTPQEKRKFSDEMTIRFSQMSDEMEKLKPLGIVLQSEFKNMMTEHAIYFTTKENETIIDEVEANNIETLMIEATQNGKLVTKDKKLIVDNRGKIYFLKKDDTWSKYEILKLGETKKSGSIEDKDLTEEQKEEITIQFEKDRIANLTVAERAAEREIKYNILLSQAGQMKNELEIIGDPDALIKSQDWLAEKVLELDLIYG